MCPLFFLPTAVVVMAFAVAVSATAVAVSPATTTTLQKNAPIIDRLLSSAAAALPMAADRTDDSDDFYIINSLLSDMILALPDTVITRDLPGPLKSVDITLTNLECSSIYLHDVAMSHDKIDQEQQVDLRLSLEVDLMCNFDWVYSYETGFLGATLSDDGVGQIYTENNEMSTIVSFTSPDFDDVGPTSSSVSKCDPVVNVVDMAFQGGVSATIANVFEAAVRDEVEEEISDRLCDELGALGDVLSGKLLDIKQLVEPYLDEKNQAPNDPLSAERLFANNLLEGVEVFDFKGTGSLVNFGIDAALNEVNKRLGETTRDSTGKEDLGVNVIMRSFLLDDDGYLTIPLDRVPVFGEEDVFVFEEASVAVKSLRFKGLDTFTHMEALNIIGSQTLQSRVALESLEIVVEVAVSMRVPDEAVQVNLKDTSSYNPTRSETLILKASARNLAAAVAFFIAIDERKVGDLQLGSLFHTSHIPECLMASLHAAELTQLHLTVGDIDTPTIESLSSEGLTRITSAAFEAITEMYKELFLEALPAIFDDTIRPLLNEMARDYLSEASGSGCPLPPDMTIDDPVVDMRDLLLQPDDAAAAGGRGTSPYGDLVGMLKSLIDVHLLTPNEDGVLPVNNLVVRPFTKRQSGVEGTLTMPGEIFNRAVELNIADLKGMFEVGVFDISLNTVDSIADPVEFLDPEGAHILDNGATFGGPPKNVRLSLGLLIKLGGEKQKMRNEMIISLDLTSAELFAAFLMKMDKRKLMQFPLRDTLNPYCWLATMPTPQLGPNGVRENNNQDITMALNEVRATVQRMKLDVQCISCTSPGLQQWSDILSSPKAIEDATGVANMLLEYGTGLLDGEFVQVVIDHLLNVGASKCPSNPLYGMDVPEFKAFETEEFSDNSNGNFFIAIGVVGATLAFILSSLVLCVRFVVRRRHKRWLKTLSPDEVGRLLQEQNYEKEQEDIVDRLSQSMFLSKSIPWPVRMSMPVVIIGNIALFLSGHLSLGGTIKIAFQLGQQDMSVDRFYDFSIAQTVIEMWNAGAKAMAMLILIFSGLWPYSKQLMTLTLWFLPPTWVSSSRRGKIFSWLDALGKYSFVDIFVLIVAMVAFRVSISSPSVSFLPEDLYSVDLVLVALWGLYANMTAQILSQLSSHVIIHYQDKIVRDVFATRKAQSNAGEATCDIEQPESDIDESIQSECSSEEDNVFSSRNAADDEELVSRLCKTTFGVGDHKPNKSLAVRGGMNYAIVLIGIIVVLMMIIGCLIPAFYFEILGIVGVVVESGQQFDRAIEYYSVFSIVRNLIEQALFLQMPAQYLGLGTLSVILVVTALVMPLVLVGLYLQLWFAPMTKQRMERTLFRIEIIKSWQYIEVFILAIIIAAWQVGGLSGYMVNEYCGSFDPIFSALSQFNIIDAEDGQCFYVRSKVESGTYVLMAGAFLLAVLSHFVCKAAAQKLHEDNVAARRKSMSIGERSSSSSSANATTDDMSNVHPVPIHFTDTYRWFLTKTATGASAVETTRTVYDLGQSENDDSSAEESCSERSQVTR